MDSQSQSVSHQPRPLRPPALRLSHHRRPIRPRTWHRHHVHVSYSQQQAHEALRIQRRRSSQTYPNVSAFLHYCQKHRRYVSTSPREKARISPNKSTNDPLRNGSRRAPPEHPRRQLPRRQTPRRRPSARAAHSHTPPLLRLFAHRWCTPQHYTL